MRDDTGELAKQICDVASVATVVGTVVNALPDIAALFTVLWTGLRIYESTTVQNWLARRKLRKERARRRAPYFKSSEAAAYLSLSRKATHSKPKSAED